MILNRCGKPSAMTIDRRHYPSWKLVMLLCGTTTSEGHKYGDNVGLNLISFAL